MLYIRYHICHQNPRLLIHLRLPQLGQRAGPRRVDSRKWGSKDEFVHILKYFKNTKIEISSSILWHSLDTPIRIVLGISNFS